jgi:DNA-binding transcriptional MocR family regulator
VSRSIREGVLRSGDRLPPIRELSPTTVSAACGLLTRAGTLQTAGRRGTVVGVSMTQPRMNALTKVLRRSDALIVEDDSGSAISTSPDLSFGSVLTQRTVHIRSYSKSHGPDLRLAAMSGPEDLIAGVQHLRQLGQGWSSRLLQRVLLNLLSDPNASQEIAHARDEYARRRAHFAHVLAEEGVLTNGTDGLNLWVPVHDETAAIMRLAVSGVAVAPGRPFQLGDSRTPHIRVTVGLIGTNAEPLAALVASAARTGAWPSTVR